MVMLGDARVPEGVRIYAVGDVHGCTAQLREIHAMIRNHIRRAPVDNWRIVHVGDYVDRGPDSRGTIEMLAALAADSRILCLRGNHDQYLADFLEDPDTQSFDAWLFNGGETTLREYGAVPGEIVLVGPRRRQELHTQLVAEMPSAHRAFLEGLKVSVSFGDYFFAHAGVRPGIPLDAQDTRDLIWIREPFLSSDADLGAVVVHGHTPSGEVAVRRNRIGIDTGAVFGGRLSCLVLEGDRHGLLGPCGVTPLATPV